MHSWLTEPLLLGFSTEAYFYLAGLSLLTPSISYFLTTDIEFSCCFPNEIHLLCFFISRSNSFSVIHVSVDKNLAEKRLDFVLYFTLKVWVGRVFALKTSSYNWVAIILHWVSNFCFLRSGPQLFVQWNDLIIRKTFAYEKEDWQGYSKDRKREMCLWWMWWFHDVRATCGYCGFFHSKKDDRFSSDSVLRHQGRVGQSWVKITQGYCEIWIQIWKLKKQI